MKAMILAAGRGARMVPLTDHCPKPLLDVVGKPLIVRHVERLAAAGFSDIVINTAHLGHMIEARLGNGGDFGIAIHYSREAQPLETGGGVLKALPLLGEDAFLLINGDVWCDYALDNLCHLLLQEGGHLILVPNPEHHTQGDFSLQNGRVSPRTQNAPAFTWSGLSVLHPSLLDSWCGRAGEAFRLLDVLLPAMRDRKISGEVYNGRWLDVGTPARLEVLRGWLGGTG